MKDREVLIRKKLRKKKTKKLMIITLGSENHFKVQTNNETPRTHAMSGFKDTGMHSCTNQCTAVSCFHNYTFDLEFS